MSVVKGVLIGEISTEIVMVSSNNVGSDIATFDLNTSEKIRDASGKTATRKLTHHIIAKDHYVGMAQKYLKKGMTIYMEGSINYRAIEGKTPMSVTEYELSSTCGDIRILSPASPRQQAAASPAASGQSAGRAGDTGRQPSPSHGQNPQQNNTDRQSGGAHSQQRSASSSAGNRQSSFRDLNDFTFPGNDFLP